MIADRGAVEDVDKARVEVQRPDAYLEVTPGMRFDVESSTDIGMSQFQLLTDAIMALQSTGPNAALQGQSGDISGRAKELDQQGGAVQIGVLFDQLRHFQKRIARATWNRVRQFWTEETWARVTDDEQKLKFVGFNIPVTMGEKVVEQMKLRGMSPEDMTAGIARGHRAVHGGAAESADRQRDDRALQLGRHGGHGGARERHVHFRQLERGADGDGDRGR